MQRARRHYSLDEYVSIEAMSPIKHEYLDGEIFAMAGASVEHNLIAGNLLALLKTSLRSGRCNVFGSDLRIGTPTGLYTYPDLSVICGTIELVSRVPDTAANPVILIEVLSAATRDYDRGEKFELYRSIPSFREYLLVEQDRVAMTHCVRKGKAWSRKELTGRSATLRLTGVNAELPVTEIYRGVF